VSQPARDGGVTYANPVSNGCLAQAEFAQGHNLLVAGKALLSLCLAQLGLLWTRFRRVSGLRRLQRRRPFIPRHAGPMCG